MVEVKLSGTLLVECTDNSCGSVLKEAKRRKVQAFRTREKHAVDVIINMHGTRNEILSLKNQLLGVNGVRSIKSRITK